MKKAAIFLLLFFVIISASAQLTGKVVDAGTNEAIPYVNIRIDGNESRISNEEGYFAIAGSSLSDASKLAFSFFGYATREMSVAELRDAGFVVRLAPIVFELNEVNVAERPDPKAIMAEVKKNLKRHYGSAVPPAKHRIFYRESSSFVPKTLDIEITESTGFSKSGLAQVNKDIEKFSSRIKSNPPMEFTDVLCNYYSSASKKNADGKLVSILPKLEVVKATKLKDETRSTSLEDMQKTATDLFLKHLDTTKYYRVKSGWFGSRDTISLRKDFKKKKKQEPRRNLTSSKYALMEVVNSNNCFSGQKMEFVQDPEIYDYTYDGMVYLNDEAVYVLRFEPRRNKANYTGKLYISESDFAVIRADYKLADGKKLDGFNMKLLLGVKMAENVSAGTVLYQKNSSGEGYHLQYASVESGQYFYLNRPLKFIELSKGEKDVVAIDLKVEGSTLERTEFLDLSSQEIAESDFANIAENEFSFVRIRQYDPNLWKDHGSIEPLAEMKRFKLADDTP